jgi:hypothetical protein
MHFACARIDSNAVEASSGAVEIWSSDVDQAERADSSGKCAPSRMRVRQATYRLYSIWWSGQMLAMRRRVDSSSVSLSCAELRDRQGQGVVVDGER